jgi:hypothetical protein
MRGASSPGLTVATSAMVLSLALAANGTATLPAGGAAAVRPQGKVD